MQIPSEKTESQAASIHAVGRGQYRRKYQEGQRKVGKFERFVVHLSYSLLWLFLHNFVDFLVNNSNYVNYMHGMLIICNKACIKVLFLDSSTLNKI